MTVMVFFVTGAIVVMVMVFLVTGAIVVMVVVLLVTGAIVRMFVLTHSSASSVKWSKPMEIRVLMCSSAKR